MLEALIDAIQDLLSNSDGNHVDMDSSDFWDQLDLQGIDLSQYTADEIREALDYALAHDGGLDFDSDFDTDIDSDHQGHEITFGHAPNDGTYLHTSDTVNVQCCGGPNKGDFDVFMHKGQKYIDFHNTWIHITKNGYFTYGGNQYYVK